MRRRGRNSTFHKGPALRMPKRVSFAVLALAFMLCFPFQVTAANAQTVPYNTYVFDRYGRAAPAPAPYIPVSVISGTDLGAGALRSPGDIFAGPDGYLYVADSGNKRILILDSGYALVRAIDSFKKNGEEFVFENPLGLFVTEDGRIHVADPDMRRVITIDNEGTVLMEIGSPQSEMLSEDFHFTPIAVLEDPTGVMYILSLGCYQGALMVDLKHDNLFLGFYGANQVQMNVVRLTQVIWRRIFTRAQRERMAQIIPVEYTNFDIDPEGFIYACSAYAENNTGQLRILNALGNNILRTPRINVAMNYGDPISYDSLYTQITTAFVDITCHGEGIFAALDRTKGRVFMYDGDSNLLGQFGKIGDQYGCFTTPAALESYNDNLVVLDSARGTLTVFGRTAYGENVRQALLLYNQGKYEESVFLWREVLAQNVNLELAYLGIGRGLAKSGNLTDALWYVRRAENKRVYADVFELYRTQFIKENFTLLAFGFLFICLLIFIRIKRRFFRHLFKYSDSAQEAKKMN